MLIAEDSTEAQDILCKCFSAYTDVEVCGQVTDGLQVMPQIELMRPHVVLLDIMMPGKDGTAILRDMLKLPLAKRPHVIVASAVNTEHVAREALDLGAEFYYIKPYDPKEVLERVRAISKASVQPISVKKKMLAIFTLINMGAKNDLTGITYAAEAACYLEKDAGTPSLRKEVYRYISEEHETTVSCVENALHTVVKSLNQKRSPMFCEMLRKSGYDETANLSNGQFLLLFTAFIRNNEIKGNIA